MDTVNLLRHIYPAFQWHIVHAPLHPSNASLEEGGAVTIHYAEVPKGCVFVISVSLLNMQRLSLTLDLMDQTLQDAGRSNLCFKKTSR